MKIVLSKEEKYALSDTCAYLKNYENSIVRDNDKSMLPLCADIALKRLSLVDMCFDSFPFGIKYRDEVLSDIEEHVLSRRCTVNSKAKYEVYVKPYLDKKRTESK